MVNDHCGKSKQKTLGISDRLDRHPSSPPAAWNEYWVEIDPRATRDLLGTTTRAIS